MNKKRLYKQNGFLHERGIKLSPKLREKLKAIFSEYAQYHPGDLELLLLQELYLVHTWALLGCPEPGTPMLPKV